MTWFNNLKAKTKLMLGFGLVTALTTIISFLSLSDLASINRRIAITYDRDLVGLSDLKDAAASQLKCARLISNVVIATGESEAVEMNIKKLEAEFTQAHAFLAKAESTLIVAAGRESLNKIKSQLAEYETACHNIVTVARAGDFKAAKAELKKSTPISDAIVVAFSHSIEIKEGVIQNSRKDTEAEYARARTGIWILSSVVVLVGLVMSYLLAGSFARTLNQTATVLQSVSQGNLTKRLEIDSADEMGTMAKALNRAVGYMSAALQVVRGSANELTTASEELAKGSSELHAGAQSSTASLEETSASLEEITSTVRQNSDNAKQASALTVQACEIATLGGSVVQSAIDAMEEINASSRKIAEIVSSIDEIAFQTNLLAVNAAVEAAHAGDHGRGFAVVAQEVRALAQRSAGAAKEIKSLIGDSVRKVEHGSQLVNQSGKTLDEIVTSVKRAADVVGEISAACSEQATAMEQVAIAVNEMNKVAQHSSESTDRISSSAQEFSHQANQLKQTLAQFVLPESAIESGPLTGPPNVGSQQSRSAETLRNLNQQLHGMPKQSKLRDESMAEF